MSHSRSVRRPTPAARESGARWGHGKAVGSRKAGGFAMSAEALPELHSIFALIITCHPEAWTYGSVYWIPMPIGYL